MLVQVFAHVCVASVHAVYHQSRQALDALRQGVVRQTRERTHQLLQARKRAAAGRGACLSDGSGMTHMLVQLLKPGMPYIMDIIATASGGGGGGHAYIHANQVLTETCAHGY